MIKHKSLYKVTLFILVSILFSNSIQGESEVERRIFKIFKLHRANPKSNALDKIKEIGIPAVNPLIKMAKDQNEKNRILAISALGKLGPKAIKAEPVFALAFKDKKVTFRANAYHVYPKVVRDPNKSVPILRKALNDQYGIVRVIAAKELGKIGPKAKSAVQPLIKLVQNDVGWRMEDPDIRENVQANYLQLRNLEQRLYTENLTTNERQRAKQMLQKWKQTDVSADRRVEYIQALTKIGDKSAISTIIEAASDENNKLRKSAREALKKLGVSPDKIKKTKASSKKLKKGVTVKISDGSIFEGKFISSNDIFITLRTQDSGEISLPIDEIMSINGKEPRRYLKGR